MTITRQLAYSAAAVLFTACSLITPDSTDKPVTGPQFEAEDYARNAKEYFEAGQWLRAREQWELQLQKQPGEWMAELGLASADHWLGSAALDQGRLRDARGLLERSDQAAAKLWDGSVEADTQSAAPQPKAAWKAALYVALNRRALADLGFTESRVLRQQAEALPRHEARTQDALARADRLEATARSQQAEALQVFLRLRRMAHPAPEVILHVAELQQRTGAVDEAESEFRIWLGLSAASLTQWTSQLDATSNVNDEKLRNLQREVIRGKIKSVQMKRIAVLVRLGNMAYDRGENALRAAGTTPTAADISAAKRHFSLAVDDLNAAFATDESRIDLLLKTAQCQGRLEQWELGIANIERYERTRAQRGDAFDQDLSAAARLKAEFKAHTRKPRGSRVP